MIDLALRQPTRQSSGGADWSRSGAATTGQFTGLFSFSTHVEANPWWEVDLGAVVPVSRIVVWNRDDAGVGGAERARPLTVLVSHDGTEWLPIWKSEAVFGGKSFGKPLTIESLVPIRARFVRLQLDRTEYLHLDQVQVYMAEPPLPFAQVQYGRRDGVMCARIVMKHDSGFFSVCSTLLETIARLHSWSVTTTEIDCSETHTVSRDAGKPADVHAGLFDMDQHVALPDSEDLAASFGPFSSSHCHWHYKTLRFDRITPFVRRFFTPRADILDLERRMIADRQIDLDRTVAVYFRGTDKSSEVKPTDVARYIEAAERAIAGRPDFRVLVQSDQAQFRDALAAHFGDRCVWFDELPVTTGSVGIHHSGIDVQQVYGVSRFEMAKRFLAAVHLMARVHHVITGTTNVGLWIALYRGHAERLWQFDAQQELVET